MEDGSLEKDNDPSIGKEAEDQGPAGTDIESASIGVSESGSDDARIGIPSVSSSTNGKGKGTVRASRGGAKGPRKPRTEKQILATQKMKVANAKKRSNIDDIMLQTNFDTLFDKIATLHASHKYPAESIPELEQALSSDPSESRQTEAAEPVLPPEPERISYTFGGDREAAFEWQQYF